MNPSRSGWKESTHRSPVRNTERKRNRPFPPSFMERRSLPESQGRIATADLLHGLKPMAPTSITRWFPRAGLGNTSNTTPTATFPCFRAKPRMRGRACGQHRIRQCLRGSSDPSEGRKAQRKPQEIVLRPQEPVHRPLPGPSRCRKPLRPALQAANTGSIATVSATTPDADGTATPRVDISPTLLKDGAAAFAAGRFPRFSPTLVARGLPTLWITTEGRCPVN